VDGQGLQVSSALSVGTILSQQSTEDKRIALRRRHQPTAPTTNSAFDYLRDNMEYSVADRRQRGLNFAIVDEVDSILIDEALPRSSSRGPPRTTPNCTCAMN